MAIAQRLKRAMRGFRVPRTSVIPVPLPNPGNTQTHYQYVQGIAVAFLSPLSRFIVKGFRIFHLQRLFSLVSNLQF